jgi:UDP-N-acetyl-D-mannosaminuronic acid dehydrogenase
MVATNHPEFTDPLVLSAIAEHAHQECLVVDPWNCWGAAQVFAYASEISLLASAR